MTEPNVMRCLRFIAGFISLPRLAAPGRPDVDLRDEGFRENEKYREKRQPAANHAPSHDIRDDGWPEPDDEHPFDVSVKAANTNNYPET